MNLRIKQAIIIIILSAVIAVAVNLLSADRIPLIGDWPSVSGSDSVAVPPSAREGDPPFISLDEAASRHQTRGVLFIDSREPEDFAQGHVRGAVNLPFDYFDEYWTKVMRGILKSRPIVVYCSGTECELSLLLGRQMVVEGYKNISIFYGGWREWEKAGLPIEKGE